MVELQAGLLWELGNIRDGEIAGKRNVGKGQVQRVQVNADVGGQLERKGNRQTSVIGLPWHCDE